jgi:hypothetical protein
MLMDGVAAKLTNGRRFHEVTAGLCRGLELLLAKLRTMDTEEKICAELDAMPEPSIEMLKIAEAVAPLIPAAMLGIVRSAAIDAAAQLPGAKTGPKAIPLSQKKAICDDVAALIRAGCSSSAAKLRASQRCGLSERSVRRIWADRAKEQNDFTVESVQSGIRSLILEAKD